MLLLLLVLATRAFADDDDTLLDTKPLGDPLPERLQQLEREWADETGVHDPVDPPDGVDDDAEPAVAVEDGEGGEPPATPTTLPPAPPPAKNAKAAKRNALRNAEPTDPPPSGGHRSDALSSPED